MMYQNQLHEANQKRMEGFDKKLDRLLASNSEISVAVKRIPDMDERITDLESESNQRKGAQAILALIAGAVGAGLLRLLEYFFHR